MYDCMDPEDCLEIVVFGTEYLEKLCAEMGANPDVAEGGR